MIFSHQHEKISKRTWIWIVQGVIRACQSSTGRGLLDHPIDFTQTIPTIILMKKHRNVNFSKS
jgi:hypothetical protein